MELRKICELIRMSWKGLPDGLQYELKEFNLDGYKKYYVIKFNYLSGKDITKLIEYSNKYKLSLLLLPETGKVKIQIKSEWGKDESQCSSST